MNIDEAIKKVQGKSAGVTLRGSVRYAQSLLEKGENVKAAVTSTIYSARQGHYPGIVALTDRRVLAVCGLPGIHRVQSFPIGELLKVEESESPLTYKAVFRIKKDAFSISLGPTVGKAFTKYVADLNADFDSVHVSADGNARHPVTFRTDLRHLAKEEREAVKGAPTDLASISAKLEEWLSEEREKRDVSAQDPLSVAVRLARQLQEDERQLQEKQNI